MKSMTRESKYIQQFSQVRLSPNHKERPATKHLLQVKALRQSNYESVVYIYVATRDQKTFLYIWNVLFQSSLLMTLIVFMLTTVSKNWKQL